MAHSSVRPAADAQRHRAAADVSTPNVCLLSNGRYTVMLTQAGSGYSTCDGIDVTRWREDATSDCWGQFFCIRDLDGAARGRPAGSRLVETPTTTRHCSVRIGPSSSGAMERSKRVPSSGRHVAEVRERRLDEYRSTAGRQAPANRRGDESYDRRAHPDRRSTVDQLDRDSTARTKGAERTRDYGNYRSGSGTSGTGSYRGGGASRGGGGRRR